MFRAHEVRVTVAGSSVSRYARARTLALVPIVTKLASRSGMSTKIRTMSSRSTT
jgi:hypothetical protein